VTAIETMRSLVCDTSVQCRFFHIAGTFKHKVQSTLVLFGGECRGGRMERNNVGCELYRDRFDGLIRKPNGRLHGPTSMLAVLFFSLSQPALRND